MPRSRRALRAGRGAGGEPAVVADPGARVLPGGQTALGGGALSSSGSVTVDLNTAFPQGTFWDVYEDNGQPFTTETIRAVAICLNA